MISIDMDRARALHRTRLRAARLPLLAALDIAWQRAMEAGDSGLAADVVAQKQVLRDLPASPAIDAAETPDQLLAAMPGIVADRYLAIIGRL